VSQKTKKIWPSNKKKAGEEETRKSFGGGCYGTEGSAKDPQPAIQPGGSLVDRFIRNTIYLVKFVVS
jgi:hypothetical protein